MGKKTGLKITASKDKQFAAWYQQVITKSEPVQSFIMMQTHVWDDALCVSARAVRGFLIILFTALRRRLSHNHVAG